MTKDIGIESCNRFFVYFGLFWNKVKKGYVKICVREIIRYRNRIRYHIF